tara:strand:+ start:6485 stop:7066 length:582 start_codon:yes stop_codon:yes gene_type:complete
MISINIFSKCPFYGNPKTRLNKLLGVDGCKFIAQQMLIMLLDELCSLKEIADIKIWVYPNYEHKWFNLLSKKYGVTLHKQVGANLASRMITCLDNESNNYAKTILIGSDIPSFTKDLCIEAINFLDKKDVILGKSRDEGFYLIGIKKYNKFITLDGEKIEYKKLKINIENLKHSVHTLESLKDIDTPHDLLNL